MNIPYIIKLGIILWNLLPAKPINYPLLFLPISPVQRTLKFSAVFGTVFPNSPITTSPLSSPSIAIVNATLKN